jgi:glutamate dehydrogenase (NAD(P)+)
MTWIKDEYVSLHGQKDINAEACCTGKFIGQGGIQGRTESTGLGVYYGVKELMKHESFAEKAQLTKGIKNKTFIVQGFGAVGYWASKFFAQDGAKIIGIVEHNSAIYNPNGIDVEAAKKYLTKKGTFDGFRGATEQELQSPKDFMERECDFLVPAAIQKSVTMHNAEDLQCRVVVEAANGPTTFMAEEILTEKGIICIPDALINGGGVTVSYFEWLKNCDHVAPGRMTKKYEEKQKMALLEKLGYKFPANSPHMKKLTGATEQQIVYTALEDVMTNACKENWELAVESNMNFRDACLVNAMRKIDLHYQQTGIW